MRYKEVSQVVPKAGSSVWETPDLEGGGTTSGMQPFGSSWGCELILHVVLGAGSQMEDSRWSDGWPDNQRGLGDAPSRWLLRGLCPRCLEGDFCLRECVHTAG